VAEKPFYLLPQIIQGVGQIVISWARVEALLAEFLSFLLKADHGAMYVLNQDIASSTQLKWVRTIADYRFTNENAKKNLGILFDRIDKVRGERNVYIHGVWGPGPEKGTVVVQTVKLDRSEWVRTELVTGPDLKEVVDEINSIATELHTVGGRLGFFSG
jgi:hypothetical protein